MPIGDPVYSDEESDLSDYAGPDEDLGFDFNFRTPIGGLTAAVPPDARGGDCAPLLRGDVADESAERAKPPRLLREIPAAHDGHGRPQCGRFNRDGTLFAYGCDDGVVQAFHVDTGHRAGVAFAPSPNLPKGVCTALRFLPAGDNANVCVVATSAGVVQHHHLTSGKTLGAPIVEANNGVFALDVRADGATFATAGRDGGVRVYDERTGRCATRLAGGTDAGDDASFSGHADRVFGLRYLASTADVLVSGGWDNTLRVWDARVADGRSVSTLRGPQVCGDAVDVEPEGTGLDGSGGGDMNNRVLVASWRDRDAVQVWDLRAGVVSANLPFGACAGARGCKPYAARWAGHGGVAYVGGSGSNEFRAIDANSGETMGRDVFGENGAVHAIDVSGGLVGVTCADGVRVYEAAR